jgi:hypothetical protein
MPLNPARGLRRFTCLTLLFGVAGCAGLNNPYQREGTWRPEQVNDANIAAMVANPRHLEQGVGDDASPGVLSAAAVRRLLTDRVKPLPSMSIGPISATQDQQSSPAGITQ